MQVGIGSLKYAMLARDNNKTVTFDIEEALSFEGETGPYLQYAVVRAQNILAKLAERDGVTESDIVDRLDGLSHAPIDEGGEADELWGLVLEAARLDEIVEAAVRGLELSALAKYAFGLAQAASGKVDDALRTLEEGLDPLRQPRAPQGWGSIHHLVATSKVAAIALLPRSESSRGVKGEIGDWMRDGATASGW